MVHHVCACGRKELFIEALSTWTGGLLMTSMTCRKLGRQTVYLILQSVFAVSLYSETPHAPRRYRAAPPSARPWGGNGERVPMSAVGEIDRAVLMKDRLSQVKR